MKDYKILYNTACPECVANGGDYDGNNLSVADNGAEFCWACHKFIVPPNSGNNGKSYFDKPRNQLAVVEQPDLKGSIKETVYGSCNVIDKDTTTYLWSLGLYEDDWGLFGLKQLAPGKIETTIDEGTCKTISSFWVTKGVYVPTYGGFIVRQVLPEGSTHPKVVSSRFASHWQWDVDNYDKQDTTLVICEDVFSGMKLAKAGYRVISLCGTALNHWTRYYLARYTKNSKVIIWLDNDRAGVEGANKVSKYVSMWTKPMSVFTDRDPKWYTLEEIKEHLK